MDDGFVIPGLNEGYTLAGAKPMEWISGLVMGMLCQELLGLNLGTSGPIMIAIVLASTMFLAGARRGFPDEERGIRNVVMVSLGFEPPNMPAPADFRNYWSGAPLRNIATKTYYHQLGLEAVLHGEIEQDTGSIFINDQIQNEKKEEV